MTVARATGMCRPCSGTGRVLFHVGGSTGPAKLENRSCSACQGSGKAMIRTGSFRRLISNLRKDSTS